MPSDPLEPAKIAVGTPKRLHPLSVFADYRKAVNIDGYSTLLAVHAETVLGFHVSANG
jgi:hypothetical protein